MSLQAFPLWLPILLLLCVVYFYKKTSAWKGRRTRLPPGPPRLPVIGNLHQLGKIPHQSLCKLSKQYGPVMYLQLGGAPTVVVSSPEAAKHVLKVQDLSCCSRPALTGPGRLSYNYIDIAFAPFGDYWREIRKACVLELFSPRRVESFRSIREEEVASMIDSISRSCSSEGCSIDLSEKVLSFTATIIYRVAFGQSFQGSKFGNSGLRHVMEDASAMLGSFCAADFFPYVGWIVDRLTGLSARLDRSFRDLDGIYQKAIDEHHDRERSKGGQEDIIDFLLKIGREKAESGGGHQITEDHIKAILMPEKFVPERFEGTSIDLRGQQQFEFLPFGGGRRGCPGMNMGLSTGNLALANLLYHFDWKQPNGMKVEDVNMEECPGLTLLKKHPLNLVLVKYQ